MGSWLERRRRCFRAGVAGRARPAAHPPGLSRTRSLLSFLGNPQLSFSSILIGGTNGKGSTAATISAILTAAGVPCGLYTSPHLVSVTERVRLSDRDVSLAALDSALSLVAAVSPPGDRGPTYFEAMTVAAFELFRRARVPVAVVEVGIGGRLDATNVLSPEVSVVTNVAADHLDVLGPALEDVAREKAGIFRNGQPALLGAEGTDEGPRAVLHAEARRIGARLVEIPPRRGGRVSRPCRARTRYRTSRSRSRPRAPSRRSTRRRRARPRRDALARTPGEDRGEGARPLLVDGAHNPAGALALAANLDASGLSGRSTFSSAGWRTRTSRRSSRRSRRARAGSSSSRPRRRGPRAPALRERLGRPDLETADSVAEGLARLEEAAATGRFSSRARSISSARCSR